MKKVLLLFLFPLLLFGINLFAQCPLPWTKKANFSGTCRAYPAGFSIGNKGYWGTGIILSNNNRLKDFWEYDPSIDSWTQKANVGGLARAGAVGFSIGNKGYIGTGGIGSGNVTNDLWEYDPLSNTWIQKAFLSGIARANAVGFSIGNKGYIGTGDGANNTLQKDFWEYDPSTNLWTQKANLGGVARQRAAGFSIGAKGYIGTGYKGGSNYELKDFWEYDTLTNTWSQKSDFGGGVCEAALAFSIGLRGYIWGSGMNFWEYDPSLDKWTRREDFYSSGSSCNVGGFTTGVGYSIGLKGYFFYDNSVVEYDPAIIYWVQKADMSYGRMSGVSFTINSKAYVGTGTLSSTGPNCSKDFWEFDPIANNWTQKANFGGAARCEAVGFTIGNNGYTGTGRTDNNTFLNDFWEYNSITNSWTQRANFGGTPRSGAIGFSIGSKGYIGTGFDATITYKDFWEYDTLTNTWNQKSDFGGGTCPQGVGFSIVSKGYAGTGGCGNGKEFWEYNPLTDIWSQKTDFGGSGRTLAVGFSIGLKGYIGTANNLKDFWEYNPAGDTWVQVSNFVGSERYSAVGFSVGNKGYIGTGDDNLPSKDFWEYTPCGMVTQLNFTNSVCNGFCDGTANLNVTGGATPYSYLWLTGETTSSISGLCIGTYTVTITDNGGLSEIAEVTILPKSTLYLNTVSTNTDCFGSSNGTAFVSNTGGLYPFSYQWSNFEATASISNLSAGTYYVTVTDGYGCFSTDSVIVNQPDSDIFLNLASSDVSCFGGNNGSANTNVTGGASPYNYNWSNGANSPFINTLFSGTYFITVTDTNGCFKVDSVFINKPPKFNVNLIVNNVNCFNGNDGAANVSVSGATPPYTFLWSNSDTNSTAANLLAGIYSITITDSNGCTVIDSVIITEPPALTQAGSSSICNGDSVLLQGNYQATSGTYYDTLTAVNGCDSVIITVLVVNQSAVSNQQLAICNGDSVFLEGNYQNTSGTYYDTLSTVNSCDSVIVTTLAVNQSIVSNQQSEICSGDSIFLQGNYQTISGIYYDSLQTVNGCDSVIITTLTVNLSPVSNKQLAICSGDSIFLQGNYQTIAGIYYDSLQTVNGCDSVIITTLAVNQSPVSNQQSEICSGDSIFLQGNYQTTAGIYYDTLSALNTCDSVIVTALTVNSTIVSVSSINVSCTGICDGAAMAVLPGGCTPQTYLWNNGANSSVITNLCTGKYFVTATQCNGCTVVDSIEISGPSEIITTLTSTPDSGNADGTATTNASGGTPPYSYLWSNGDTTASVFGLLSSVYFVTVTDANGCSEIDSIQVPLFIGQSEIRSMESGIIIFPNPTSGKFVVQIISASTMCEFANYELKIYNMLGEVVRKSKITSPKSEIDLNSNGSGLYYVEVITPTSPKLSSLISIIK